MNHPTAKPFPADGAPLTADARSYRVQLTPTIDGGYVLRVLAGTHCEWVEDFTTEREARLTARAITVALRGHISIWQVVQDRRNAANVVADAERFIQAAYAAVNPDEVADGINADWNARHAQTVEARTQFAADVQAITAGPDGWRQAREQASTALDRMRHAATLRGAHTTSDAMNAILTAAAHTDGRIQRGGQAGQATSTQLVALASRGLITLTRSAGRNRQITGGHLTAKGYKHAGVAAPLAA